MPFIELVDNLKDILSNKYIYYFIFIFVFLVTILFFRRLGFVSLSIQSLAHRRNLFLSFFIVLIMELFDIKISEIFFGEQNNTNIPIDESSNEIMNNERSLSDKLKELDKYAKGIVSFFAFYSFVEYFHNLIQDYLRSHQNMISYKSVSSSKFIKLSDLSLIIVGNYRFIFDFLFPVAACLFVFLMYKNEIVEFVDFSQEYISVKIDSYLKEPENRQFSNNIDNVKTEYLKSEEIFSDVFNEIWKEININFDKIDDGFSNIWTDIYFGYVLRGEVKRLRVSPDGKGDFRYIGEAIEKASAGDIVFVSPGIYTENLTIDKELYLEGDGDNSSDVIIESTDGACLDFRARRGGIRRMTLRRVDDADAHCVVVSKGNFMLALSDVTAKAGSAIGIYGEGTSAIIVGNNINDSAKAGVVIESAKVWLEKNQMNNNGIAGAAIAGGAKGEILNCNINNNGTAGIGILGANNVKIIGNDLTGNGKHGAFYVKEGSNLIQRDNKTDNPSEDEAQILNVPQEHPSKN